MESKTQSQLTRKEQPFGMDLHLENCEFDKFLDGAEYGHNLSAISHFSNHAPGILLINFHNPPLPENYLTSKSPYFHPCFLFFFLVIDLLYSSITSFKSLVFMSLPFILNVSTSEKRIEPLFIIQSISSEEMEA